MEDDNDKDLFDGTLDASDSPDGSGEGDTPPAPQSASGPDGTADPSTKRINDLMSRAQKAEAENARLKKQLGLQDGRRKSGDDGATPAADEQPDEFQEYLREAARRDIFRDSGLADFGLDVSVISGATLREMKESADRWKTVATSLASKARQDAFVEAGVSPEAGGGQAPEGKSFASMSDKEFEEFLRERDSR